MDEKVLTEEIRKGNREAMQVLYGRTVGYLAGICQRYLSNPEDVKDVLQDSYLHIFQHIDRFSPMGGGSLRNWMARVVVNRCVDHLRSRQHWQFADDDVPDVPDEPVDWSEVKAERLHELIRQLPTGYRTILNLYVFEQKSHQEIAAMLGIKPNTSSSQYHRAKALLRKMILQHKEDFE